MDSELPEVLLRGRVGFNSTGIDADEQPRNGPRQTAADINRRQTKKRLDDYFEQQALKRELESF
ncbi:MAG: PA3496 family putative envelope integrity protein [Shewanella sp.]